MHIERHGKSDRELSYRKLSGMFLDAKVLPKSYRKI